MKTKIVSLLTLINLTLPQALLASPEGISVQELITKALNESPLISQIEAKVAGEKAHGIAIGTLENPSVDAELRIPSSYRESRGSDEITVSLTQPLRLSDFSLRTRINNLIQNSADSEKQLALLELTQTLRLSFVKAWALEKRLQQLEEIRRQATELESAVKKGASSGLYGAGEEKLFRAETLKLQNYKIGVEGDLLRARAELSRQAGFPVEGTLQTPNLNPPPPSDHLSTANGTLPVHHRAKLAARLASEQSKLAKLDAVPKFAPRIVYERTNDHSNYLGFGFSVDLPLFDRNRSEQLRASVESTAADASLRYLSSEAFERELLAVRQAFTTSIALVKGYEQEILPVLRDSLAAQKRLMQHGQGSAFQVWQTLRELSLTESEAIEHTIKAHSERAQFVVLTGQEF